MKAAVYSVGYRLAGGSIERRERALIVPGYSTLADLPSIIGNRWSSVGPADIVILDVSYVGPRNLAD